MNVYKIYPDRGCNPHYEDNIESALDAIDTWLIEGGIGTEVIIEIISMTQDEFNDLPEYEGP